MCQNASFLVYLHPHHLHLHLTEDHPCYEISLEVSGSLDQSDRDHDHHRDFSIFLLAEDHLCSWIALSPAAHHLDFWIVPAEVDRHHDFLISLAVHVPPVACHHGFSTALAAFVQVLDHAEVVEDPEAVEEATVTEQDTARWCTDSQRVQEEPSQKEQMEVQ